MLVAQSQRQPAQEWWGLVEVLLCYQHLNTEELGYLS